MFQLLDYGISLKVDTLSLCLLKLGKLIHLMLMLSQGKSNTYVQSVLMSLMIQSYQSKVGLPHHAMIKDSMSMNNEEAGEITFSVLSRCCLGDTTKKRLSHMDDMYRNIHNLRSIENELKPLREQDHGRKNWRKTFKRDDETVTEVRSYFISRLRAIKANQFMQYDGSTAGYRNSTSAANNQVAFTEPSAAWMDEEATEEALILQFVKCQKFTKTDWGYQRCSILPEMAPSDNHNGGQLPVSEQLIALSDEEEELEEQKQEAQVVASKKRKKVAPVKSARKQAAKKKIGGKGNAAGAPPPKPAKQANHHKQRPKDVGPEPASSSPSPEEAAGSNSSSDDSSEYKRAPRSPGRWSTVPWNSGRKLGTSTQR